MPAILVHGVQRKQADVQPGFGTVAKGVVGEGANIWVQVVQTLGVERLIMRNGKRQELPKAPLLPRR